MKTPGSSANVRRIVVLHENDDLATALTDLSKGEVIDTPNGPIELRQDIPSKHKFLLRDLGKGHPIRMYGVVVAEATSFLSKGDLLTIANATHRAESYHIKKSIPQWQAPDVSSYKKRTFLGYHRSNGSVGTMNYWLVVPLVFCENRNIEVMRMSLESTLGYGKMDQVFDIEPLVKAYKDGASGQSLLAMNLTNDGRGRGEKLFSNVDGIKFLTHESGCGVVPSDAEALCRLLAGYIAHPNVGGATVLSLGCQHSQIAILRSYLEKLQPDGSKPVFFCEQQKSDSERSFISGAIKETFVGLSEINSIQREPAGLDHLVLGLECGGSDGFSGISANPALGVCTDLIVGLGGTAILAEFPELHGVEQTLINRCIDRNTAGRFSQLMQDYQRRAKLSGSGFKDNPSPGNRADGLITDAIKSAGAARKGGTSPIVAVLDYGETATVKGLNLLCTPGNDVESTTGLAGAGANVIVFTTGLGTPTGNPITPTIKVSTNTFLAQKMPDIIDLDAGTIIEGIDDLESKGAELLELVIKVASGQITPHAVRLGQDDFIPWKRGISL